MVVWQGLKNSWEKKRRKSKGKKERYTHLNAEFQRIAKRAKKAFLSDQRKEIEENSRMGKTRDLFKKMRDTKGTFHAKMGTIKDRNGTGLTEAEDIWRDKEPWRAALRGVRELEKTGQLNWLILIGVRAYKIIKQGDNIQPCCTPFPIWNQSVNPADVSNLICGSPAFLKSALLC